MLGSSQPRWLKSSIFLFFFSGIGSYRGCKNLCRNEMHRNSVTLSNLDSIWATFEKWTSSGMWEIRFRNKVKWKWEQHCSQKGDQTLHRKYMLQCNCPLGVTGLWKSNLIKEENRSHLTTTYVTHHFDYIE